MENIEGKDLICPGVFSEEEAEYVIAFIEGTRHREEFTNFIMHLHNHNAFTDASLGYLLRYVDIFQLQGLLAIVNTFSFGKGVEEMLSPAFFDPIRGSDHYMEVWKNRNRN